MAYASMKRVLDREESTLRAQPQTPAWLELENTVFSKGHFLHHRSQQHPRFVAKARVASAINRSEQQLVNRSRVGKKVMITAGSFSGLSAVSNSFEVSTTDIEELRVTEAAHICIWDRRDNFIVGALSLILSQGRINSFHTRGTCLVIDYDDAMYVIRFKNSHDGQKLADLVTSYQELLTTQPPPAMESQLDEFDVPRIIRRAATSSIEVYEAHDSPLIDLFLEDTEGPYVHLCVNFKGRDSILCISSQPLDSAREVPKINLPLEVFVGDVSFEDCFRGLYQRNPPPGSSFGPDGVSWSGAIGFYLMDQARRDEKYFITVAHNFARGDPANGEANFAANETLPAGTPALQPTKAGLQNDIRNCQLTIRSTEASIEDYHRQSRFRAEEIAKEEHKCLVSHSQILMSLPHTAAHQIGHLTTVYELNVDEHMYWDYCLVRVHDNRLGLNRVQGTAIRRIMKSADLDLDEEMLRKQGPSTGETFGRFLEVSSSFGNHPRFPGCRFRMPVIVAGGGIGGGGLWCSKGDSGAPITWRDNAVGIVYGHATATQDDNQVEVQVGVFGELASILQRIKERFGLELVLYAGDD